MISTGISELDQRLGGLTPGRYYLLTGTPGAGKTSACLHFIAEGLRSGEPCAILTQENPDDLFAQARFIGHDFRRAVADDTLALLQYRLDFADNYARVGNPKAVSNEMLEVMTGMRPRRLIVDSILPFIQSGGATHGAATALVQVMDELQATAYFTVPGDLGDSFYARLYDPLISATAGIIHFEMYRDDIRQMSIRKIRQAPMSSEPLRFLIRPGLGIVEINDAQTSTAPVASEKRVALINSGGFLGGDLYTSLEHTYEVVPFASTDEAMPAVTDNFSLVLVAVDALTADSTLSFVREVRRVSGVPVILVSHGAGLRSVTRTRALHAGADDFLAIEESAHGLLSRIEAVRLRGPSSTVQRLRPVRLLLQPRDERGHPVSLPEGEIARAVRHNIATSEHPFFALVRLRAAPAVLDLTWSALGKSLRLDDGDLIAHGRPGELVLYLHDISRRHARELLSRIFSADPRFDSVDVVVDHFPADAPRIESWLADLGAAEAASTTG